MRVVTQGRRPRETLKSLYGSLSQSGWMGYPMGGSDGWGDGQIRKVRSTRTVGQFSFIAKSELFSPARAYARDFTKCYDVTKEV